MRLIRTTWEIRRQALWLLVAVAMVAGAMATDELLTTVIYSTGTIASVANYVIGNRKVKVEIV